MFYSLLFPIVGISSDIYRVSFSYATLPTDYFPVETGFVRTWSGDIASERYKQPLPTVFGRGQNDNINVAHALMVDRENAEGDENTWYEHTVILWMN